MVNEMILQLLVNVQLSNILSKQFFVSNWNQVIVDDNFVS